MKTLFEENRLVYMSPMGAGPGKAPKGIENADTAEQALQIMTPDQAKEAGRTARDRISRLADKVKGNTDLHKKLVELDKKLDKAIYDVDAKEQEQAKAIGKTILELNKVIDTKLPDVRKQILDSSIKVLGKVKSHGQKYLDSLVSAFSMMKVKDTYKQGDVSLKREGNKLFVNNVAYDFNSQNIAGKITWRVKQGKTAISGIYDPIDYKSKMVKQVKTETLKSKLDDQPTTQPKKVVAKPKATVGTKPEKAKESTEASKKQLLAETFKIISNPDVSGQELTPQQLSALQNFTKSVGRGEVKHFKHGNTEAYVARSKDGAVWRISTKVKFQDGTTTSGSKFYAPRVSLKIDHNLPKQYKGKVAFKDNPPYTIKDPSELAAGRKPATPRKTVDTKEPAPDPKILKMFQDGARKAEQAKYLADGMKPWVTGVKKTMANIAKSLQWFSKAKALAKDIQSETNMPFPKAADLAVKFKSRCENCDRDLVLKTMSPDQVISRVKSAIGVLPPKLKASYAAKFKVDEGETRLASLKKGVPAQAGAPAEVSPKSPNKPQTRIVENLSKPITKETQQKLASERGMTKEQYDQMVEKNVQDINSKLAKLKVGKYGVGIDLHNGENISIYRSSKDTFHYFNDAGKKITFSFKDGAFVRNLAQQLAKNPQYSDAFPPVDVRGAAPKKAVASKPKAQPKAKEGYEVKSQFSSKDVEKSNEITEKGKDTFVKKGQQLLSMIEKGDILDTKKIASLAKDIMGKISEDCFDNAVSKYLGVIKSPSGKLQLSINLNLLATPVNGVINISDGKKENLLYDTGFQNEVPMTKKELNQFAIISPRENKDIQESVGELKKMLEGKKLADVVKSNGSDLKEYIAHIAGVHKRKNIPGNYNITEGYTMSVSKDGIVKLAQKGESRIVRYTPPTERANA